MPAAIWLFLRRAISEQTPAQVRAAISIKTHTQDPAERANHWFNFSQLPSPSLDWGRMSKTKKWLRKLASSSELHKTRKQRCEMIAVFVARKERIFPWVLPRAETNYTESCIMTGFVTDGRKKKPSPLNLQCAYSSTDAARRRQSRLSTVTATQTVHGSLHFCWAKWPSLKEFKWLF